MLQYETISKGNDINSRVEGVLGGTVKLKIRDKNQVIAATHKQQGTKIRFGKFPNEVIVDKGNYI